MALKDYERDMLGCSRCSLCKWIPLNQVKSWRFSNVCPAISRYNFHAYSGSGKMIIGLSLLQKRIEYTDKMLDIIYKCNLCGACDVSCKVCRDDIDLIDVLEELRARCIEDGQRLPTAAHRSIIESVKNYDNVWMQPRTRRDRWAKGIDLKDLSKQKADVLYYVGCTYAYNPELQKTAKDTVSIMKRAGIDIGILGNKELCCGSPILRIGQQDLYNTIAKQNIETFNKLGISKVVTSCAGCYSTLKIDYTKYAKAYGIETNYEVLHAVEYIWQFVSNDMIELKKELPERVTYHDPCHIGRRGEPYVGQWEGDKLQRPLAYKRAGRNGIYEPPRNLLNSIPGIELIEMERIKEYAWCCGGGGGVKSAYPDFALWTAKERIEEAKSTGAESIVTCCPWCKMNLGDAIKENKEKIKLYDLVELVLRAMG